MVIVEYCLLDSNKTRNRKNYTMAENSLINFDSVIDNTLNSKLKFELKRKTRDAIICLYKDVSQLVNPSDPLLVSTMNSSEFMDVSEFDPVRSRNEMSIASRVDASINTIDCPNSFPRSNHKNVTKHRFTTEKVENERKDTDEPNIVENTTTHE